MLGERDREKKERRLYYVFCIYFALYSVFIQCITVLYFVLIVFEILRIQLYSSSLSLVRIYKFDREDECILYSYE